MSLRSVYVAAFRAARPVAQATGVLALLERSASRPARWLRSLFAIYDLDDLVALDLPWWTFSAIDAVETHLATRPQARVFEWGSGASTVWLSRRAAHVTSVEHDLDWAVRVLGQLEGQDHVRLSTVPAAPDGQVGSAKSGFEGQFFDAYVQAIHKADGPFDLIVIDGRAREACLTEAMKHLAPGGLILIDDFKRARYRAAAAATGLRAAHLDGLAVCLPLPDSTALLSRPA